MYIVVCYGRSKLAVDHIPHILRLGICARERLLKRLYDRRWSGRCSSTGRMYGCDGVDEFVSYALRYGFHRIASRNRGLVSPSCYHAANPSEGDR
jgi:hypothetical protein